MSVTITSARASNSPGIAARCMRPWLVHVAAGQPLYAYTAVFAPVKLSTRITHSWQHYDAKRKRWVAVSNVSYPINGGRDGGYRGYTIKSHPDTGEWRVDFATAERTPSGPRALRALRTDAAGQVAVTQTLN